MAGTINYLYDPNQEVYVIITDGTVSHVIGAVVLRCRVEVLITSTEIMYDVRLNGNQGTKELKESDIFADKSSAVAEYETRIH